MQVPTVSVNFSAAELRNPKLAEKLKWELDRFGLAPDRLTVEILETVVAETDNDVIVRNVAALAALGCGIDLDDFGTGHASITNIRRFALRRLKIDRSFVTRVDEDREQQKLVSAILSMAERLGLDTLAEGVETPGEHAMLSQLGCGHVQGFGIGRPMPSRKPQTGSCATARSWPAAPPHRSPGGLSAPRGFSAATRPAERCCRGDDTARRRAGKGSRALPAAQGGKPLDLCRPPLLKHR